MKLTYTKKELEKEVKRFSIYYGREELMSEHTKKQYKELLHKIEIYEKEKRVKL